jgi:hypothetical protein
MRRVSRGRTRGTGATRARCEGEIAAHRGATSPHAQLVQLAEPIASIQLIPPRFQSSAGRCMVNRRTSDRIPFSYSLLVISLLHFSVYSIGVSEAHSRDFFLRELNSIKGGYSPRLEVTRAFVEAHSQHQQLEQLDRLAQESFRDAARSHAQLEKSLDQHEKEATSPALAEVFLAVLFFFAASGSLSGSPRRRAAAADA